MLIKPPLPPQPQPTGENPAQTIITPPLQAVSETKPPPSIVEIPPSIINTTQPEDKSIVIRKKRQYKMFLKLLKQGKYTNALITSRILGIDRATVQSWLNTPLALKCIDTELNTYISKIQSSKDWKAQAYLLDKAIGQKEEEKERQDLKQMIVINT